jgi:hypothetical protein
MKHLLLLSAERVEMAVFLFVERDMFHLVVRMVVTVEKEAMLCCEQRLSGARCWNFGAIPSGGLSQESKDGRGTVQGLGPVM